MKILILSLLVIFNNAFCFNIKLDGSLGKDELCIVVKDQKFKGCCSHHKGIKQCGLDSVVTNLKWKIKCNDNTISKTCKVRDESKP